MKELAEIFWTFVRVGALTLGGGYAMLPLLQREIVEKHGWATGEELMDWFAIGQCTPGVIAVNSATFAGRKVRGIPGAIAATLGMITPSLIIIIMIAAVLQNFAELPADFNDHLLGSATHGIHSKTAEKEGHHSADKHTGKH